MNWFWSRQKALLEIKIKPWNNLLQKIKRNLQNSKTIEFALLSKLPEPQKIVIKILLPSNSIPQRNITLPIHLTLWIFLQIVPEPSSNEIQSQFQTGGWHKRITIDFVKSRGTSFKIQHHHFPLETCSCRRWPGGLQRFPEGGGGNKNSTAWQAAICPAGCALI